MEYRVDRKTLREGPVDDDNLRFATSSPADALEPALTG
jgi:monooxygenase